MPRIPHPRWPRKEEDRPEKPYYYVVHKRNILRRKAHYTLEAAQATMVAHADERVGGVHEYEIVEVVGRRFIPGRTRESAAGRPRKEVENDEE